jgi:hypothetical protein
MGSPPAVFCDCLLLPDSSQDFDGDRRCKFVTPLCQARGDKIAGDCQSIYLVRLSCHHGGLTFGISSNAFLADITGAILDLGIRAQDSDPDLA